MKESFTDRVTKELDDLNPSATVLGGLLLRRWVGVSPEETSKVTTLQGVGYLDGLLLLRPRSVSSPVTSVDRKSERRYVSSSRTRDDTTNTTTDNHG